MLWSQKSIKFFRGQRQIFQVKNIWGGGVKIFLGRITKNQGCIKYSVMIFKVSQGCIFLSQSQDLLAQLFAIPMVKLFLQWYIINSICRIIEQGILTKYFYLAGLCWSYILSFIRYQTLPSLCVPFLFCCIWTVSELYRSCICSKDWLSAIVAIVVYYTDIFDI